MTSGILGVPLGSYLSTKLSKRYPRADPIICAVGLLLSAPLLAASMILVTVSAPLAYIAVFLGQIALNLNWAIVADMLLVRIYYFCLFSKLLPHLYLHYYSLVSNYFCLPVSCFYLLLITQVTYYIISVRFVNVFWTSQKSLLKCGMVNYFHFRFQS